MGFSVSNEVGKNKQISETNRMFFNSVARNVFRIKMDKTFPWSDINVFPSDGLDENPGTELISSVEVGIGLINWNK